MIDFFILGNPRSGTTLLRLMLAAHSQVIVPPEAGFAVWLFNHWDHKKDYSNKLFINELFKTSKFENWCVNSDDLYNHMESKNINCLGSAINSVYSFYAMKHEKVNALIGDKNNFYTNHIKELNEISPSTKFIHIVRDGRDVACSYRELMSKEIKSKYAPILSQNIIEIAKEWKINNQKVIKDLKAYPFLRVRLEDLVTHPKIILNKICDFLEIEFQDEMLEYYSDGNSKLFEPIEFEQWKSKNRKPLINENFKYKELLNITEINAFEKEAGNLLSELGYEVHSEN